MAQLTSVLGSDRLPKPWRIGICSHCAPKLLLLLLMLDLVVLPLLHSVANCSTRATVLAARAATNHIASATHWSRRGVQAGQWLLYSCSASATRTVRLATTAPPYSLHRRTTFLAPRTAATLRAGA